MNATESLDISPLVNAINAFADSIEAYQEGKKKSATKANTLNTLQSGVIQNDVLEVSFEFLGFAKEFLSTLESKL